MGSSRLTRTLMVLLLALTCCSMLLGCGGEGEAAVEADLIRPPKAGERCDRTWQGPSEKQAVAATLFLDRRVARPGGTLWAAIENRGDSDLTYGIEPLVERRMGSEWVDQVFPGMAFPLLALTVDPKTVSVCIEVPIPRAWRPGLYRVSLEVTPDDSVERIGGPGFPSYFRIVKPAQSE